MLRDTFETVMAIEQQRYFVYMYFVGPNYLFTDAIIDACELQVWRKIDENCNHSRKIFSQGVQPKWVYFGWTK